MMYFLFEHFHCYLNYNFGGRKFTMYYDHETINFLDIKISKTGSVLMADVYIKSTDRSTLLHARCFHPVPLKRGLPVSQFTRIRRIYETEKAMKGT